MPALADLIDDFDDDVIDAGLWPGSFGAVSETGGRARVACDSGFSAYSSGLLYSLAGSAIYLRVYPPSAGGATTEAWAQVLVQAGGGTDLMFEIDALGGVLKCMARSGYFDPDVVAIPYEPDAHAWLRISETAGTVTWETGPNPQAWTVRRTRATPEWAATGTELEFQLLAHRGDGTPDAAEFDSVNVPRGTVVHGATSLVAVATLAAEGRVISPGSAALASVAALDAAGRTTVRAAVLLEAAGGLTAVGHMTGGGAAVLAASSNVTAAGRVTAAATRGRASAAVPRQPSATAGRSLTPTARAGLPSGSNS
ncbi:hypothetical protein ACIQPQ_34360 [Streptomyces sp. NPDC091281]|uniref:hypothetical protein n=1 Tax=Streptomyces sp. NPDC091281 TaxID=3365985 RepID=UPI00382607B9